MNFIINSEKYHLNAKQKDITDVYRRSDGIINMDALEIYRYIQGMITHF